ncbi:MAG: hypothetical protein KC431_07180, partial [Myxococcales bacterium]|nr:hypothetical protein [Myxococcales bacterium]
AEDGGFHAHTRDPEAVGVFAQRRKPLVENAAAARFFIELHGIEDGDGSVDSPWLEHARRTVLAVGSPAQIESRGKVVAGLLIALELLMARRLDVTVVGGDDDPRTEALWRAALALGEPRAAFEKSLPGVRYPDTGKPAVYLCTDRSCSRPLSDPATLREQAAIFIADQL